MKSLTQIGNAALAHHFKANTPKEFAGRPIRLRMVNSRTEMSLRGECYCDPTLIHPYNRFDFYMWGVRMGLRDIGSNLTIMAAIMNADGLQANEVPSHIVIRSSTMDDEKIEIMCTVFRLACDASEQIKRKRAGIS